MGRKKLNVKREFNTGIQQFVEQAPKAVFTPQTLKDKLAGNTDEASPLDDSEIVVSNMGKVVSDLEEELEILKTKYSNLLDERDEWKKKYEEAVSSKKIPAKQTKQEHLNEELLKSEYELKEAILLGKIENLTEENKKLEEKLKCYTVNNPPQRIPPGFSSASFRTPRKELMNGYESW